MKLFILPLLFILHFADYSFSQPIVRTLDINGYSFFSELEINNMMVTKKDKHFNPVQFSLDLKNLRDKYKSSGFLFSKITESRIDYNDDSSFVEINIFIEEGSRVRIGEILFEGNNSIPESRLREKISTARDDILNENTLNNDIISILNLYEERGKPFAKVFVDDVSVYNDNDESRLRIKIGIVENAKIKIDRIRINGNETTNDQVILREVNLDTAKPVTTEYLQNIKSRLERLNIFESVSLPRIYTIKGADGNRSGLLIEVKEGNNNTFDGVLGYIPPANENESGYFTGLVNVSLRNLFGTGRKLEFNYKQEVRETQNLAFRYFEPYVLGYPVNMLFGFQQRIQDTTYTKRNLDLKADVNISETFSLSGVGSYERVIPSDIPNPVFLIADSRILSSGLELRYDSRDNVFIPSTGILYRTFYSYGSKQIFNPEKFVNFDIRDNYSIQKYWMDLEFYYTFFQRQTSLIKIFGGEVKSDRLEDSDFFRVGGTANLRGYRDEQFLASRFLYSNIELRYALSRRSFLFGFYDPGYYFKPADIINNIEEQKGFLFGYGLGIRLETEIGLIGVSYALGKGDSFLDGKIHFGLINNF